VTTPFLAEQQARDKTGRDNSLKTETQEREHDGADKVEAGDSESTFSLYLAISQRHCTMLISKV
jgi:hypothetical protein